MKSKNLIITIITIIVMCVMFTSQSAAEEVVGITTNPNIEIPTFITNIKGKQRVGWSTIVRNQGAAWLKIHLSQLRLKANDHVNITNSEGVTLYQLKGSELSPTFQRQFKININADKSIELWLPALEGDQIQIELVPGDNQKEGRGFLIDEVAVGVKPLFKIVPDFNEDLFRTYCVCQSNDLWDIACLSGTSYFTKGQAVGRILYQREGYWYVGTGFLLSCNNSNHFLTTFGHVNSQSVVDNLEVTFFHQYTTCGGSTMESTTTVFGDILDDYDQGYDFALIELTSKPVSISPLEPLNRAPVVDDYIYIPQHFNGLPKQIGFGTVSSTTSSGGLDFSYYIDTDTETHGAPVIATSDHKVLGYDSHGNCPNEGIKMENIYTRIKNYIGCN